jgi:hypothetical protein
MFRVVGRVRPAGKLRAEGKPGSAGLTGARSLPQKSGAVPVRHLVDGVALLALSVAFIPESSGGGLRLQFMHLAELQRPVRLLPAVQRRLAEVHAPSDGFRRLAALQPAWDREDLLPRLPLFFCHIWGSLEEPRLSSAMDQFSGVRSADPGGLAAVTSLVVRIAGSAEISRLRCGPRRGPNGWVRTKTRTEVPRRTLQKNPDMTPLTLGPMLCSLGRAAKSAYSVQHTSTTGNSQAATCALD